MAEESHIRLYVSGRPAPGFTEVFGSPCGGDFAGEVKNIVSAVGSGVPERLRRGGVGPCVLSSPKTERRVATSNAARSERRDDRSCA